MARFFRTVDDAFLRAGMADRVGQEVVQAVGRVGVAAGGGDGFAGRPDARAGHQALVDRITQGRDDLAAQVAHAGEAGLQGLVGVADRTEGVVLGIQAEAFGVAVRIGLVRQVHVQVDEAGAAGMAGQVDGLRALDVGLAVEHGLDAVALDHDGLGAEQAGRGRVEGLAALQGVAGGGSGVGGQHEQGGGGSGREDFHGRFL